MQNSAPQPVANDALAALKLATVRLEILSLLVPYKFRGEANSFCDEAQQSCKFIDETLAKAGEQS